MKLKIKELREQLNKSQQEIANDLGLKIRTYQEIERGNNQANYETLIKLSNYFNRSIDYILDNINEKTYIPPKKK
ncbi:MAG: helix-turn-helix transcriptional regulator [Clostridiales bacterium]|nr:helix-turn-helix transcriptional regulator [Clostridiales bacterium]